MECSASEAFLSNLRGPSLEEAKELPEVSVVMPCLNEADTVAICIRKAKQALREQCIQGEIIVADNGSTDGSQAIAAQEGARLVRIKERGYGNALMGGIASARGKYVIMGDAYDSYDFLESSALCGKAPRGLRPRPVLPSTGGRRKDHVGRYAVPSSLVG